MATKTQILVEDYLRMTFEHDREYVHGEIVERGMPTFEHGYIQGLFCILIAKYRQAYKLYAAPEVRMRLSPDLIRIPDVAVFAGAKPPAVPSEPPLVVIEIVSPDDRWHEIIGKLREFHDWGVPNVWLVDPETKSLFVLNDKLKQVDALTLPGYDIRIIADEVFV